MRVGQRHWQHLVTEADAAELVREFELRQYPPSRPPLKTKPAWTPYAKVS